VDHGAPRTAIVTGAGRGIGAAIARRLAHHGHGVAILDRDVEAATAAAKSIDPKGTSAFAVAVDVADERSVSEAVTATVRTIGAPTILVNDAGFARDQPIEDMSIADWDAVVDVHLRGAFLMTRATCEHMRAAGWGRIVNISSVSALGDDYRVNYSAAKSGLHGFTKACALELGPSGITANVVAPGFIVSDMTAATARRLGRSFEEHQQLVAATLPVRRVGQPDDIANAVSYLTSDGAGYVTGQILYVAGSPMG
jgi:3-oxoacyl-[acyl-carrier protein] reductase